MGYYAKIIADSVSEQDVRLTTVEIQAPLIIWAELLTHRQLSRNAASNRAIPVQTVIDRVEQDPFEPLVWGKNCKGMQSWETLSKSEEAAARGWWRYHNQESVRTAQRLLSIGLHKQWSNRVLGAHQWITAIISSTHWANLMALRIDAPAQPEARRVVELMYEAIERSEPVLRRPDEWHLPYVAYEERKSLPLEVLQKVSVARCARVSYLTHDGKRDIEKDVELHDQLLGDRHMSPFEHVAEPAGGPYTRYGNFAGWWQYRKSIPGEVHTEYRGLR